MSPRNCTGPHGERARGAARTDHGHRAEHRHERGQPGNGVATENASAAATIAANPATHSSRDGRAPVAGERRAARRRRTPTRAPA